MGKIDEHWCSDCKRRLDKQRDHYLDIENIRMPFEGKKGIICSSCLEKPEYESLRKLLGAGNPNFQPFIECALHVVCSTFKAVSSRPVRCAHIAVVGDTVYCKRRHPGSVKLPVERAERLRLERELLMRTLRKALRRMPEEFRESGLAMFEQAISGSWQPPSGIISSIQKSEPIKQ